MEFLTEHNSRELYLARSVLHGSLLQPDGNWEKREADLNDNIGADDTGFALGGSCWFHHASHCTTFLQGYKLKTVFKDVGLRTLGLRLILKNKGGYFHFTKL